MILGLTLGALALVLLCGALLLWRYADQRSRHLRTTSFVEGRIQPHEDPEARDGRGGPQAWTGGPKNWNGLLLRAGIAATNGFYLRVLLLPVGLGLLALVWGGLVSGLALFYGMDRESVVG